MEDHTPKTEAQPPLDHRRWAVPLALASGIILADQATKWWAVEALGPAPMSRMIPLIGDWSRFVYTRNTGMAFSLFQNFPQLLTLIALTITIAAIYFYWKHLPPNRALPRLIIGLIVGGGLGNLIDRVRLGYVVDFISIGWFPVFNIADSAISVGAALLMVLFLRDELAQRREDADGRAISA